MTAKQVIEVLFWTFIVIALILITSLVLEICEIKIFSDEWLMVLSCLCGLTGFITIEMIK